MRRTPSPARHRSPLAPLRVRALPVVVATLAVAVLGAALTSPALAAPAPPAPVDRTAVLPVPGDGTTPAGGARPLATIEDEEAWCSYLSSYYLAFPSPWSARLYNCQHHDMSVAPVYSNGTVGSCVRVPARHSRHLGGNVAKWVTDIRVC